MSSVITDPRIISIHRSYQQHWADDPDLVDIIMSIDEFVCSYIQATSSNDGGVVQTFADFAGISFDDVMVIDEYLPTYLELTSRD